MTVLINSLGMSINLKSYLIYNDNIPAANMPQISISVSMMILLSGISRILSLINFFIALILTLLLPKVNISWYSYIEINFPNSRRSPAHIAPAAALEKHPIQSTKKDTLLSISKMRKNIQSTFLFRFIIRRMPLILQTLWNWQSLT